MKKLQILLRFLARLSPALALPGVPMDMAVGAFAGDSPSASPERGSETSQKFRELLARENWEAATNLLAMAKRLQHQPNGAEGRLMVSTPILIDWDLCARKAKDQVEALKPAVYQYPWLEFDRADTGWVATVHLRYVSWPHCAWKLKLRLLDRSGSSESVLHDAEAVIENPGTIEKYPEVQETDVRLNLPSQAVTAENQQVFQLALETLWIQQGNPVRWGEALPLSLDFSTAETSGILRCKSLELVKTVDGVRAAVQTHVVSSPECHWRFRLTLYDAHEQVVGTGQLEIENSGFIRRAPMVTMETFKIAMSGESRSLHAAQRWNLRIERISPDRSSRSVAVVAAKTGSEWKHVQLRSSGIGEAYTRAIGETIETARMVALDRFGFDMPEMIYVSASSEPNQQTRLFNDGKDRITLRIASEAALARPATSRVFHLYGFCHEVGHLAMYRVLRERDWLSPAGAEGWAHYAGSRILDEVYAIKGESLWPDSYDYLQDGTARLRKQLAAPHPQATTQAAGLWMELADMLGEKELAPLLTAWAGLKADHATSVAELRRMLVGRGDRNRLEGWWKKAEPVLIVVTAKSDFAAETTTTTQLKGEPKELSRDDGASAGKRSVAGSAHVVRFDAPGEDSYLTAVRIFGSRYGQPGTAGDQAKVGLCDNDFKLIATFTFPYATFEAGEPKWLELPIRPTRVPKRFMVSVGFNPTATKGVFVHHDREGSGNSFLGLPGREGTAFDKGDWLIRAVVCQAGN